MEPTDDRLRVHYRLTLEHGEDPEAKAREIALEQTVELPAGVLSRDIRDAIVGRVEKLGPVEAASADATISFDPSTYDDNLLQLLNLLFGNVSLKSGIRIVSVDWPDSVLARFRGPRFGISGLRALCGDDAVGRPLLCGALKPLGFSPAALADLAYRLARGGADIVKDDHGLADQSSAPFDRRVEACQAAVQRANSETGGATLYFPHVTGGPERLEWQLDRARTLGCRGVLVSPMLVGLETCRQIAERHTLALVAHPSMAGAFFGPGHGLAPDLLLGQIFRLAGHDAVIYPNVGGRFPLDAPVCEAINDRLRRPWNEILPAFPAPGGGIDGARLPHWIDRYGPDTIFLIGGSLYAEPDLESGTRKLAQTLRGD